MLQTLRPMDIGFIGATQRPKDPASGAPLPMFGTKYADPATLPTGTVQDVAFSPAGDAIALVWGTGPFIMAYPWSVGSGFGVKYTDPATLPTGTGFGVAFSPAGDAIAVAHDSSPRITVYPFNL